MIISSILAIGNLFENLNDKYGEARRAIKDTERYLKLGESENT